MPEHGSKDAEVLYDNRRYDSALYLCGYAIEAALKAKICRTLKWSEFPSTRGEFRSYQSLRTHDLDVLLSLSGVESMITTRFFLEWSRITGWSSELRYKPVGRTQKNDAFQMIEAAKTLVNIL